jgi:penicillin-binding protein 2
MANSLCIVANKGYYYTPHFVEKIDNETNADTAFLNKYRSKHEVLTHIPDTAYNAVIAGMHDVVERGTARIVQIPGIEICAKTGTAENFRIIDRKRTQLKDNSMFVCFAPKNDPKIAIAVVVENAGFGATWAGPIARILLEKYLNDTLMTKSKADLERISAANLMPPYLERLQFIEDSIRARKWLERYGDSTFLKRYISIRALTRPVAPSREVPSDLPSTTDYAFLPPGQKLTRKPFTQPASK